MREWTERGWREREREGRRMEKLLTDERGGRTEISMAVGDFKLMTNAPVSQIVFLGVI